MNTHRPLTDRMLSGPEAAEAMHMALSRRQICQDKRSSLGTHRSSCEFAESSEPPVFCDELDEHKTERRVGSWVGSALIILALTCAAMGAVVYAAKHFGF